MYNKAGPNVLAHRLRHIIVIHRTPADTAVFNDIIAEIILILEDEAGSKSFLKGMADLILFKPVNRQKRFLYKLAVLVLEIGQRKGAHGKKEKG